MYGSRLKSLEATPTVDVTRPAQPAYGSPTNASAVATLCKLSLNQMVHGEFYEHGIETKQQRL